MNDPCVTLRKTFIHLLLHSGLLVWKKGGIYSREIFFLSGEKSNFEIYLNRNMNQKFSKLNTVDHSNINFYPLFLIISPLYLPKTWKMLPMHTKCSSRRVLNFLLPCSPFLKEVRTLLAGSALKSGKSAIWVSHIAFFSQIFENFWQFFQFGIEHIP